MNSPLHSVGPLVVPEMPHLPAAPCGVLWDGRHLYAVRAHYEDTDLSGVVYHANYVKWFERARSDMLRLLGVDQRAAVEAGEGAYVVSRLELDYLAPAKLDDVVTIESSVGELGAASVRLVQTAFRGDQVLCRALVRVGFVAPDGRAKRQPAAWRAGFAAMMAPQADAGAELD